MVGTTQLQPQNQPLQPPASTAAAATSAEEEALKRNTDCVYFLASPLTCKKGADCEYRHSDVARVNPRDCWFWLNGNCLNPKCGFRHPPVDGLLGNQPPTPVGSSMPTLQTAVPSPVSSTPHNSGKQAVPCIFFQKGLCLKGDRCPFLHVPPTANNKILQVPGGANVSEPPTLKKSLGGLEKCSQELNVQQANTPKPAEYLPQLKPHAKVESGPPKNGVATDRYVPPSTGLDEQPPRYRKTNISPAPAENSISRSNRVQQVHVLDDHAIMNSRDADEFSREPSPGFDVLVDDDLRDSDYYHNEDHYGSTRAHEGRNLNQINDYEIGHSADYDSMVDVDRDMYCDPHGYDSYDRMHGQYPKEQRRNSSEKILVGSGHFERRRYPRANSPEQIGESDLRYRLSKQRRVNGLRSVISHDRTRDNHAEDRSYRGPARRDAHYLLPNEGNVSNRLRGRIKLPERSSSPVNGSELHPDREMERGRSWGRLSPGRSQVSTRQGRVRDRIKERFPEDINSEERSFRGPRMRDAMNDTNVNFAGPKSLAELKGGKNTERNKQQMSDEHSLGKRKYSKLESHQQPEEDLSFEGPKPLSEILKRKRAAATEVPGKGSVSASEEDANRKEEKSCGLKTRTGISSLVTKEPASSPEHSNNREESKSAPAADVFETENRDDPIPREETKSADYQSRQNNNANDVDVEDGIIVDDAMEDHHDPETFDQREGESDYEQLDGEDFNLDEAENAEGEEYLDDDDGDDFAKKIGVMFS